MFHKPNKFINSTVILNTFFYMTSHNLGIKQEAICFAAIYAVLSRFTHFLCGDKLRLKRCPWKKITNIMYE